MRFLIVAAFSALASLSACGASAPQAIKDIDGYSTFKFGDTFESVGLPNITKFNPVSADRCLKERAFKGCLLGADRRADPFETIDGIPYNLGMEFNRRGALVGIMLDFDRAEIVDGSAVTQAQCADVHDRTVDWLSQKYGSFDQAKGENPKTRTTTSKGNPYFASEMKDGNGRGYFASGRHSFASGRYINIYTAFIVVGGDSESCSVHVSFSESDKVEGAILN